MRRTLLRGTAATILTLLALTTADSAQAQVVYQRVDPYFLAPAPYTYGAVVSPPPYYIYDPAPMVYVQPMPMVYSEPVPMVYTVPAQPGYVEAIPVSDFRYKFSLRPDYRYSYRHARYTYQVDRRESTGGHLRYKYKFNRGRVKAKLKYRP